MQPSGGSIEQPGEETGVLTACHLGHQGHQSPQTGLDSPR